jgi:hypothetical protein
MKTSFLALLATLSLLVVSSHRLLAEEPTAAPSDQTLLTTKLKPHELRSAINIALRREATANTPAERAAAIVELSNLYLALARDTEMASDSRLKHKALMFSRLSTVKRSLEQDVKRRKAAGEYPIEAVYARVEQQGQSQPNVEPQGGGAVRDYGETLVELIQQTISPEHWDVNGGPGTIVYWPNLQVLVVRASGEGHGRVHGLVEGLRAAK